MTQSNKKIIVVGNLTEVVKKELEKDYSNIVVIENPADAKEVLKEHEADALDSIMKDRSISFTEPILIHNPYKHLKEIENHSPYGSGKPFVCKGKHQYRESDGEWICQCGRKL